MKPYIPLVLGLLSASCMVTPGDGGTVASTADPVRFMGYYNLPDIEVAVQAFDPARGAFEPIGHARTGTSPTSYDGIDWYQWSAVLPIPAPHWTGGAVGSMARVKASVGELDLYSATAQLSCLGRTDGSLAALSEHCLGAHSPEAHVSTRDYVAWSASTDLVMTSLGWAEARVRRARVRVDVLNAGPAGVVSRIECASSRSSNAVLIGEPIGPGARKTYEVFMGFWGLDLTCTVIGATASGAPEVNTDNNTKRLCSFCDVSVIIP